MHCACRRNGEETHEENMRADEMAKKRIAHAEEMAKKRTVRAEEMAKKRTKNMPKKWRRICAPMATATNGMMLLNMAVNMRADDCGEETQCRILELLNANVEHLTTHDHSRCCCCCCCCCCFYC